MCSVVRVTWPDIARIGVCGCQRRGGRVVVVEQAVEPGEPFDGREERAQVVGVRVLLAVGGGLSRMLLHIAFRFATTTSSDHRDGFGFDAVYLLGRTGTPALALGWTGAQGVSSPPRHHDEPRATGDRRQATGGSRPNHRPRDTSDAWSPLPSGTPASESDGHGSHGAARRPAASRRRRYPLCDAVSPRPSPRRQSAFTDGHVFNALNDLVAPFLLHPCKERAGQRAGRA